MGCVEGQGPAQQEVACGDQAVDEEGLEGGVGQHGAELGQLAEADRSEEHTSELQSQSNLVCRLLLEKKKTNDGRVRPALRRAPHAVVRVDDPLEQHQTVE